MKIEQFSASIFILVFLRKSTNDKVRRNKCDVSRFFFCHFTKRLNGNGFLELM